MQRKPDLQDLVRAANEEVHRTARPAPGRRAPTASVGNGWRVVAACVALALVIALSETHRATLGAVLELLTPARAAERTRSQLQGVLEQARTAVEAARGADGSLPEALPHAALSAVVYYERAGSSYRLSAASAGVRVVLDSDGNRSVTYPTN